MRSFVDVVRENAQHEDRAVTFMRTSAEERKVSFPELWREAKRRGRAMLELGLKKGDRVATLCWNHHAHLEAYFGIPAAGGVMHTLNLRLAPAEKADPRKAARGSD